VADINGEAAVNQRTPILPEDILYAEIHDDDGRLIPAITWFVEEDIRHLSRPEIWRIGVKSRKNAALTRLLDYLETPTGGAFENLGKREQFGRVLVNIQYTLAPDWQAYNYEIMEWMSEGMRGGKPVQPEDCEEKFCEVFILPPDTRESHEYEGE